MFNSKYYISKSVFSLGLNSFSVWFQLEILKNLRNYRVEFHDQNNFMETK